MNIETLKASVVKFLKDEEGLTVVEYAVAGGLVSLAVVGAFAALGGTVGGVIEDLDDMISTGGQGTAPAPTTP